MGLLGVSRGILCVTFAGWLFSSTAGTSEPKACGAKEDLDDRMMPYRAQVGSYELQLFKNGAKRYLAVLSSHDGKIKPYRVMGLDFDADGSYERGMIFNGSAANDPLNCQWGYADQAMPVCASFNREYATKMLEHAVNASQCRAPDTYSKR